MNVKIQYIRAVSIVAVLMIHTLPNTEIQIIIRPFINFAVATFLFLSGYLTKFDNNFYQVKCLKRLKRVLIPYVIWTVIYTLLHLKSGDSPFLLLRNLLTGESSSQMYFIVVYVQFVIITPLLFRLAKSKYRLYYLCISPIVISIKYYFLLSHIEPNYFINLLIKDSCLSWFSFYYVGILLGNKMLYFSMRMRPLLVLYLVAIIFNILEGLIWYKLGDTNNAGTQLKFSSIITSLLFILIVYRFINDNAQTFHNEFLKNLGDYSFGIYLSHMFFLFIVKHMFYDINFIYSLFIVLFCSYLFNMFCKKFLNVTLCEYIGVK